MEGHEENTDLNAKHWGEEAKNYESKHQKTIQQIIEEIRKRKDWIGVQWAENDETTDEEGGAGEGVKPAQKKEKREVRLLDYACGTGLVTKALAPYITQSIGIDLTPGMVSEFNLSASHQGLPPSFMQAYVGNLVSTLPSPSLSVPQFFNFDIAVVGLGFHHFDDPSLAATRLAERLKKGGTLLIVDFLTHDKKDIEKALDEAEGKTEGEDKEEVQRMRKAMETITHHGFGEGEVKRMFEDAGCGGGFEFQVVGDGVVFAANGGTEPGHGHEEHGHGHHGHSHGGHGHGHGEEGHGDGKGAGLKLKRTLFMARGVKL